MITQNQLYILQHSLGLNCFGEGSHYRNRFVTGPGGSDFKFCKQLCGLGFMTDHGPQEIAGGMHCFTVTEGGKKAVREFSPKKPKLTRSQERYQRFLRADFGMSFRDFLKVKETA